MFPASPIGSEEIYLSLIHIYDNDGNLTGVTYPDGSGEMYIYDDKGRLSIHVDREGNKTCLLYTSDKQRT